MPTENAVSPPIRLPVNVCARASPRQTMTIQSSCRDGALRTHADLSRHVMGNRLLLLHVISFCFSLLNVLPTNCHREKKGENVG